MTITALCFIGVAVLLKIYIGFIRRPDSRSIANSDAPGLVLGVVTVVSALVGAVLLGVAWFAGA